MYIFQMSTQLSIIFILLAIITPFIIVGWLKFGHLVKKNRRSKATDLLKHNAISNEVPETSSLTKEEILQDVQNALNNENLLLAEEYLFFIHKHFTEGDIVRDALYTLIEVTYTLEKFSVSEEHAKRYVSRYGQQPEVLVYLGKIYIASGNLDEAEHLFTDLKQEYPDNIDILYGIAQLHRKKGDHDRARSIQQEILELEQKNRLAF